MSDTISAAPTKRFFVSMLVRDIALEDAVLDLLDNCIDGVIRAANPDPSVKEPYKGFEARITMKPDQFSITDNCGGIPKSALEKAFRMGRPEPEPGNAATVGMYGIGMKRAIFKMGTASDVISRNDDFAFKVSIAKDWLENETTWELPITELSVDDVTVGTTVTVHVLYPEIAARFDEKEDNFISYFRESLAAHYAFILEKGFKVFVNEKPIGTQSFTLLMDIEENQEAQEKVTDGSLKPYVFSANIGGVQAEIYAGLRRPLPSDEEIAREEEARQSRDDAGWTIVCNDRVVVYRDKTRLTGWGEASVPSFHGQFIAFGGIVILKADDPWKLPLTTTKRGIDASSELYSTLKDYMREATKTFTSFTNKWKKNPEERSALYQAAKPMSVGELRIASENLPKAKSKKLGEAERYVPTLPVPRVEDSNVRISYSKSRSEFNRLAEKLFETTDVPPKELGEETFNALYKQLVG